MSEPELPPSLLKSELDICMTGSRIRLQRRLEELFSHYSLYEVCKKCKLLGVCRYMTLKECKDKRGK